MLRERANHRKDVFCESIDMENTGQADPERAISKQLLGDRKRVTRCDCECGGVPRVMKNTLE